MGSRNEISQGISVSSDTNDERRESQTVLFFGKTGDGKSTLGNMLLFSNLEGGFETGASLGSVTKEVEAKSENNWTVIDTVGLGEAVKDSENASKDALNKFENFFATNRLAVDHICYVMRKGEFTKYERVYWQLFQEIFGTDDRRDHIRLIFTSASTRWLDDNADAIKDVIGDYPMISVDFPPKSDDDGQEKYFSDKRERDLTKLRDFFSEQKRSTPEPVTLDGASLRGQDQSKKEAKAPGAD